MLPDEGALETLYDLVGVRVICAFNSDVYHFAEWLRRFRGELKRCADEIVSVDISMQTIREILQEQSS